MLTKSVHIQMDALTTIKAGYSCSVSIAHASLYDTLGFKQERQIFPILKSFGSLHIYHTSRILDLRCLNSQKEILQRCIDNCLGADRSVLQVH